MKIFVSQERQKSVVTCSGFEAESVVLQRRRVEMFEPTTTAKIYDECVIVIWKLAEDVVRFFDDLRCVFCELLKIVITFTAYNEAMLLAANVERDLLIVADLERRVVKDIEVRSAKCIRTSRNRRQTGRDFPFAEWNHGDGRWRGQLSGRKHQRRGVVPESVFIIKLVGADRKLVRI